MFLKNFFGHHAIHKFKKIVQIKQIEIYKTLKKYENMFFLAVYDEICTKNKHRPPYCRILWPVSPHFASVLHPGSRVHSPLSYNKHHMG